VAGCGSIVRVARQSPETESQILKQQLRASARADDGVPSLSPESLPGFEAAPWYKRWRGHAPAAPAVGAHARNTGDGRFSLAADRSRLQRQMLPDRLNQQ
jgi:hypothetical protein